MTEAEQIRAFNRYYMSFMRLLNRSYLESEYSPTDARILYEIRSREKCTANVLISLLHLDKGYMSRTLRKLETKGLIMRNASPEDSRVFFLHLTDFGMKETDRLIRLSNAQMEKVLSSLTGEEKEKMLDSMDTILKILGRQQ